MGTPTTTHMQEKSELEKLQLFYEHINDGRPPRKHRHKRSR